MKAEYFNRELTWVEFNARVLGEAQRRENPLLERLRFLSIVSSNFDEFFMVRVASLKAQIRSGARLPGPAGFSPEDVLSRIHERVHELSDLQYAVLMQEIMPSLAELGLVGVEIGEYDGEQIAFLQATFQNQLLSVLTPVRFQKGRSFPQTGNLRTHILFELYPVSSLGSDPALPVTQGERGSDDSPLLSFVQIPHNVPRLIWLPSPQGKSCFTLLEHAITANASLLFPGYTVRDSLYFRITRDADLGVDERKDEDFVEAMEEVLVNRRQSTPVRLEISRGSESLRKALTDELDLDGPDIYQIGGPMDLTGFSGLVSLPGYDAQRYARRRPRSIGCLRGTDDVWEVLKRRDLLLHHPYDSFEPVVRLLNEAASDPDVLAIKMTLYRTSGDSPVVQALVRAAEDGKQVVALVELKARFDEERNIGWAERLEKAGVIVIYGIVDLKVHAKALLIVRREEEGVRRYVHLGTGNYNDRTAQLYVDLGLLTSNDLLAFDVTLFFNTITGYSTVPSLRKLAMAPLRLKARIIQLIEREAKRSTRENPGLIMVKLNSLTDTDVIGALYSAAQAGVRILLNVRGPCMLVPGRKGLSEGITVVSVVGRFLEHARIAYFSNGGQEEVYLSSADWMPRNLERRVELMFPVEQADIKAQLVDILQVTFEDNVDAHVLNADGTYSRRSPKSGEEKRQSQEIFYQKARQREKQAEGQPRREFAVRRKPPAEAR